MNKDIFFYKKLIKHNSGLLELLSHEDFFKDIPEDWYVFVVDVENSTLAVQNGMHEKVNLASTGSIVTILNEIKKTNKDVRIPYFFGGDGTTFIIPSSFQKKVLSLLENYRHHIKLNTSLILRVGCLKVIDIYQSNHKIKIAKLALTKHLTIPIVLGTGLKYAEHIIKSSFINTQIKDSEIESVNLTGMECRWKEIKPKEEEKKIVCLIVYCSNTEIQADIYKQVFQKINNIFGSYTERSPISNPKLQLELSINKIRQELKIKLGNYNFFTLLRTWLITVFGNYYFKVFKERIKYFRNIPLLSDTIMMDGTLHTVFSGPQYKINQFILYMDELETQGKVTYGVHTTHASIMSCYVENREHNHIHFVDGTEGGYTIAAMMYKTKI